MQDNKAQRASHANSLVLSDVCLRPNAAGFDLAVAAGALCVVLGGNNAGKTNLCRLIAGLPSAATGQVVVDGADITDLPARERPVAMVYQAFVNYPNFTVAENIASPLRAQANKKIDQRVAELAQTLRIEDLLDRYPNEISGGQQQRLAIARALAKGARVLVLDEPLVNLDFKLREALTDELREILIAEDCILLYTTSDQRDAFTLADHLVLLAEGEIQQIGRPLDLYTQPASLDAMALMSDTQLNAIPGRAQAWVRAEHVYLDEHQSQDMTFQMSILGRETDGRFSYIRGMVEGCQWVVRAPGVVDVERDQMHPVYVSSNDVKDFHGRS